MIYYKRALWMKTLCNMLSYLHFLLYCYHSRHVGVYYNCFNECVMSVSILSVRWRVVSECGSCWQFRSRSLPEVCYEIIDKSFHCDLSVIKRKWTVRHRCKITSLNKFLENIKMYRNSSLFLIYEIIPSVLIPVDGRLRRVSTFVYTRYTGGTI